MSRIVALLALVFLPWVAQGEDWIRHESDESGYSIEYPAGWIKDTSNKEFDLYVTEPNNEATLNLTVREIPKDLSLSRYYTSNLKELLNDSADILITDNCKDTLDGNDTFWIRYSREGVDITQYVVIANGEGFVLTMGVPTDQYDMYKKTFDKIVDSFQIKEKS